MDLKQKLIELVDYAKQIAEAKCNGYVSCTNCPNRECGDECTDIFMAEELIANGVTIQKWIPVSERLPNEEDADVTGCVLAIEISDGFARRWEIEAIQRSPEFFTHWTTPPKLPKGE